MLSDLTNEIVEAILPARYVKTELPELYDAWPYAHCDQDRCASVRYYQSEPNEYVAVFTSLIDMRGEDRFYFAFRIRVDHWDAGTRRREGSESFYMIPEKESYKSCYERLYAYLFDCIEESNAITDEECRETMPREKERELLKKLQAMSETKE